MPNEMTDHSGMAEDRRRETVDLTVPAAVSLHLSARNHLGKKLNGLAKLQGVAIKGMDLTGNAVSVYRLRPGS